MPTAFELVITLDDLNPAVWRRVRVPADLRLDRLHAVVQAAFGWTNSHLHQFIRWDAKGKPVAYFEAPSPDGEDFGGMKKLDERKFTLDAELRKPGDALGYEYDFGDSWMHCIELTAIIKQSARPARAMVLDGARACPPDDSGGPPGYEMGLKAARDPKHPDHADYAEWYGDFDPEKFDLGKADRAVGRLKI